MSDKTDYASLYKEIYSDLLSEGYKDKAARELAYNKVGIAKEIIEDVLQDWFCILRKVIPIESIFKSKKEWKKLDGIQKKKLLNYLGIDVKLPWRMRYGVHVGIDEKPTKGLYVEGSERIDAAWIKTGKASWDAELEYQKKIHGIDHANDLRKKMKGKG